MTSLTQTQWNVLTYIKHFEATEIRMCRNVDIQFGCGLENKQQTRDVLIDLERKRYLSRHKALIDGVWVPYARSNPNATGSIGIVFEDAKEVAG